MQNIIWLDAFLEHIIPQTFILSGYHELLRSLPSEILRKWEGRNIFGERRQLCWEIRILVIEITTTLVELIKDRLVLILRCSIRTNNEVSHNMLSSWNAAYRVSLMRLKMHSRYFKLRASEFQCISLFLSTARCRRFRFTTFFNVIYINFLRGGSTHFCQALVNCFFFLTLLIYKSFVFFSNYFSGNSDQHDREREQLS